MKNTPVIWLASYPRSGNTLLRIILWHCFALKSASVYANDLGGNQRLEQFAGHIEHRSDSTVHFPPGNLPLVKTHRLSIDQNPAIYVIRDGRDSCASLWEFYGRKRSLHSIVSGEGWHFGSWHEHVQSWNPSERPRTLLLRYEDMVVNLNSTLEQISEFLDRDIVKTEIPTRHAISQIDGRWVRAMDMKRARLSGEALELFNELNHASLERFGYV